VLGLTVSVSVGFRNRSHHIIRRNARAHARVAQLSLPAAAVVDFESFEDARPAWFFDDQFSDALRDDFTTHKFDSWKNACLLIACSRFHVLKW
jgi:hypothetical protein